MSTMFALLKQEEIGPEPEGMDTSKALEFQIEIEKLFHKNQLFPRIKGEFTNCKEFDFEAHMRKHDINVEFGMDLLVQMVLHKRAPIQTLVGSLRKHLGDDCQKTADELIKALKADLVDWHPVQRQFIIRFGISPDIQEDLDRYQYPLPMVVEPKELTCNRSSGYYTGKDSVILRHNHHELDVCLDHLNAVNKTKFKVNQQVATTIKNRWRNLDKPKPDEEAGEYQKRVKAFEKFNNSAFDVMHHLGLAAEGEFYFTHKVDKRGRTYCQGYVCNYQGNAWQKAMIEFANQEVTE
ncbi:MAG: hypothetical protein EOQ44_25135 [Mesorhizobium sp.]|uniref:hypothetical protein n=1 Tax=Mesorhizobium sp. TaxID=1871066 RepID=UPI000FE54347|nr:hypothetical protein [Mesorhizobium sp.]RWB40430.1 MAG: hypothetical protein EOQ44_25135 [Mesorhizobium sp.]